MLYLNELIKKYFFSFSVLIPIVVNTNQHKQHLGLPIHFKSVKGFLGLTGLSTADLGHHIKFEEQLKIQVCFHVQTIFSHICLHC